MLLELANWTVPFVTVEAFEPAIPAIPPPDAPMMDIVPEEPLMDCDRVMLFDPTNTIWKSTVPVVPAVFPPDETPIPPPLGAEIVIVAPPAALDCESVILFPPTNNIPLFTV